jgi:hypothetical protein
MQWIIQLRNRAIHSTNTLKCLHSLSFRTTFATFVDTMCVTSNTFSIGQKKKKPITLPLNECFFLRVTLPPRFFLFIYKTQDVIR